MMLSPAGRLIGRAAFLVLIMLIVAESALRLGALVARDRAVGADGPAAFRVLALGDSHTYGVGVPQESSYPAQLGRLLGERAPGVFRVINKGLPGFSTSMVRKRLPLDVGRYHPDMVLLWVGINDTWNLTDIDVSELDWRWRLDAIASKLRVYRLARVWFHDRRLERDLDTFRHRPSMLRSGVRDGRRVGSVSYGGIVEPITVARRERTVDEEMRRRAEGNYDGMVRWLRTAGIEVAFIEYPVPLRGFAVANEAMRAVAERHGVPVVRSQGSVARLSLDQRKLLPGAHPNADMYAEIARDVVPVVLARHAARKRN